MSSSQQPPAGATPPPDAGGPSRKRTVWQVAPTVPHRRNKMQFGMWTMLFVLSVGGPIVAAATLLPLEFYGLNALLFGSVFGCFVLAFGLSFLQPRWAFSILALSILFGVSAHIAVYTNRFHLENDQAAALMIVAWAMIIATAGGFVLSYARHDQ